MIVVSSYSLHANGVMENDWLVEVPFGNGEIESGIDGVMFDSNTSRSTVMFVAFSLPVLFRLT